MPLSIPIPVFFLIAAALLGFVIGWFFNRIYAIRTYNRLASEGEAQLRRMTRRQRVLTDDNNILEASLEKANAKIKRHEGSVTDAARNVDRSGAEIKQRDLRIDELESNAFANEEQHMRLQRDFAKFRLVKTREVQQLQQQLLAAGGTAVAVAGLDDSGEVPVLNKKAPVDPQSAQESLPTDLPDVTHGVLESEEDLMEMTSEFNFDPEELLADD